MNRKQWARGLALAAAALSGLGLFCACLQIAAAQAANAPAASSATTRFVNAAAGNGLAAYWPFDDNSATTARDFAGSTNLTLHNGASLGSGPLPPISGNNLRVLNLDGSNDFADVLTPSASLNLSTTFSVAGWVRRSISGTYDAIYDSGIETNKWWVFIADNNRLGFGKRDLAEFYSTHVITDTRFHHVAVVKNGDSGTNLTFYVDGVQSGQASVGAVASPSGSARVGVIDAGGLLAFFGGTIDDLRVYRQALTAAQVQRLAQGKLCESTGLSWAEAHRFIQCALEDAGAGDTIWVAAGSYRTGVERTETFATRNGVSVFGGFNGTESSLGQRPPFNPSAPLTILSGDVAGNDLAGSFANTADNSCHVVFVPAGFNVTLDGLGVRGGNANCAGNSTLQEGGGLIALANSRLSLNNMAFQANQASSFGGGVFNLSGPLTVSSALFFSNTANLGGGLGLGGGNVTITASGFVSNSASQGGAIDLRPGQGYTTLAVSGGSFTGNQADDGGAVEDQVFDGLLDLSFAGVSFTGNHALGGDGGAVSNTAIDPGVVRTHVSQSTFTGNIAEEDGGAISDFGGQLTIDSSQLTGNSSPNSVGGALEAQSVVTVTNSTFQGNNARSGGAALVSGTLNLSGSSVILNQGQDPGLASDLAPIGGGVLVSGTALITNTQFLTNTAFLQGVFMDVNLAGGGGLAVIGSLALGGGEFRGNSARQGGGLQVIGSANIQNSLFQGNTAGEGGGVFADGGLILATNRLIDNTAALADSTNEPGRGGGVLLQNGGFGGKIVNNLFLGNQALSISTPASGAAIVVDGQATLVSNNTIVGRGLITTSAGSFTGTTGLFNNIITSHTVAIEALGGTTFDDYNLFHANTTNISASGVISSLGHSRTADPRFVAPALDDFRLRLDSPAVDAGDNNRVPGIVTTDLSGGPRFVDVPSVPDTGAGSAPIVDIGAYEVNARLLLPLVMK